MSKHPEEQHIFDCLNLSKEYQNQEYLQQEGLVPQNDQHHQNRQNQYKVDNLPPTRLNDQGSEQQNSQFQGCHLYQQIQQQKTYVPRIISSLQTSQITQEKRKICIKGQSYQTQNLGKHLKTITVNFLQMLSQAKFLDSNEKEAIESLNRSNGAIKDFMNLFQVGQLRKRCLGFYSSRDYIISVMSSYKMNFHSKLMMIKYAQKLRSLTYSVADGWKLQ